MAAVGFAKAAAILARNETRTAQAAARDAGFSAGTIAALAVIYSWGESQLWLAVIRAAGVQAVLRHALTNEGDWEWAGFKKWAVRELGRKEVTKARRAVRADMEGGVA